MTDKPDNPVNFWQELKRRKVVRVIIGYLAFAYVLIELTDMLAEPWGLPGWTINLITILLIIGLVVTVIISWIFDITPEGIKKTTSAIDKKETTQTKTGKRKLRLSDVIIAVLLVAVIVLVYPRIFNKDKLRNIRQEDGRIPVTVMPVKNMTNDSLLDFYQEAIQAELINDLTGLDELRVTQFNDVQSVLFSRVKTDYASITPSLAIKLSRDLKTNLMITGSFIPVGDRYRLNLQLINTNNQEAIKAFQVEGTDLIEIEDSISVMIIDYLSIQSLKEGLARDIILPASTNNPEALRYYIEGTIDGLNLNWQACIQDYEKAIHLDSSFAVVYITLSFTYFEDGQVSKADSILKIGYQYRDKLPASGRTVMEGLKLRFEKDFYGGIREYEQLVEIDPESRWTWNLLGDAYLRVQDYEKCIDAYEKYIELDERLDPMGNFNAPYVELGDAYHNIGNHDRENELYEIAYEMNPLPWITYRQLICALSRGDSDESNNYKEVLKTHLDKQPDFNEIIWYRLLGSIYLAADLPDSAEYYLRRAYEMNPDDYYNKVNLANYLVLNEAESEESIDFIDNLFTGHPNWYTKYLKGISLHSNGSYKEALSLLKEAWEERPAYDHDHFLKIREVERALAKDKID